MWETVVVGVWSDKLESGDLRLSGRAAITSMCFQFGK